jgi:hypothetical protein
MKINLDERQLKNLLLFLDRVKYEGLAEAEAISEIITIIDGAKKGEVSE